MSTKSELIHLVGEDEARQLLEEVDWLDDSLVQVGVKFKAVSDELDAELERLSPDQLRALQREVERELRKRQAKKIKLVYRPGPTLVQRTAKEILAQTGSESVEAIQDHRQAVKERAKIVKSPLEISFKEGLKRIEEARNG